MKRLKKHIIRNKSCLTDNEINQSVCTIKDFPAFFGCVESEQKDDLFTDMEFFIEEKTGLIQLNKLIPLDIMYNEQHAYGVGNVWNNHYNEFATFISKNKKPGNVVEIGGSQDKLAKKVLDKNDCRWTIIEPNPSEEIDTKIKVIQSFFEESTVSFKPYNTVVISHVLEHAYNPKVFLFDLRNKVNDSTTIFISYPQLEVWLEKKYTNSLNFEHNIFLTEHHLDTLIENVGFNIISKHKYEDHSVFYELKICTPRKKDYANLFKRNKYLLINFVNHYKKEVKEINKIIKSTDKSIYLFGGHIFSQYLTVFRLNTKKIISILDNSPQKQGRRLYGTNLMVFSPKILKEVKNPLVILRAANYNNEIKNDIIHNINDQTEFC